MKKKGSVIRTPPGRSSIAPPECEYGTEEGTRAFEISTYGSPNRQPNPKQQNKLTYQEIVQQHIELFGVEPIVTGANHWDDSLIDRVLNAIDSGQPYIEESVEDGTYI